MSLSIAIMWLIGGMIIGAAAARIYSLRQFNQHKLQVELDESRQQLQNYRTEVSNHLETTHQLMSQLQDNYEKIANHMARTKMQLIERPSFQPEQGFSYLSADTAQQLRMSIDKIDERRRNKAETNSQQPLDYAGHSSGLMKNFSAEKTTND